MGATESDLVPLSALQHMVYCPRQCALIHNEQQWIENALTADGRLFHERADSGVKELRRGVTTARRVPVRSMVLGVSGIADLVEVHKGGRPYPVEYKRGKPKAHRADEVQLCAQAMCLEEMLGTEVPEGALYYGRPRRRTVVAFDRVLRSLTTKVAQQTRSLLLSVETPPPHYVARKCNACSLRDTCQPRRPRHARSVVAWLSEAIDDC